MPVRFIIGRAGSGKTQHCVEALVRAAENNPLGPPLFWLVPEQAAFMSERRLMAHPNLTGTFRIYVTGFRRLYRFLAGQLGISADSHWLLEPSHRILLLSQAIQQCAGRLRAFADSAGQPGFLTTLDHTLRELIQNDQTPASLAVLAAKCESSGADPALARKLADLSLLLEAWQNVTGKIYPDPETLPQIIAQKLLAHPPLRGTRVWVDAFSSMSRLEMQLLAALAGSTDHMDITLLADPQNSTVRHSDSSPDELSIFYRTQRLRQKLIGVFKQNGVKFAEPLLLKQNHRFKAAPALAQLENYLFDQDAKPPPASDNLANQSIQIWHSSDPEDEVLRAGRFIRDQIAAGGRYRDIGIIVSDLAAYEEPLRRIFSSLKISFFLDQRRGVNHHPLICFLRGVTELAENNFARNSWLALIKTHLAGVNESDANLLENYMLSHGIDNDDFSSPWKWSRTFSDPDADQPDADQSELLAAANNVRSGLHEAFAPWLARAAKDQPVDARELVRSLADLINRLQIPGKIKQWITAAQNRFQPELAQMHEQLWGQIDELLTAMNTLLAGRKITPRYFSELLSLCLQTLTLGLVPPAVDQVLISSTERSRHPELKTVIVLGALEGLMPRIRQDQPVLNDGDRRALQNVAGDGGFDPPADEDFLLGCFFDYVAFTRAAENLIVSVPLADAAGRNTVPSVYIRRIRELFPDLPATKPPESPYTIQSVVSIDELIRTLVLALGSGRDFSPPTPENHRLLAAYHWLKNQSDPKIIAAMLQAWKGFTPRTAEKLSADLVVSVTAKQKSVSELETIAACRLQWFFRYVLGLSPRSELTMQRSDLGDLYHRTLRAFFQIICDGNLAWPDCGDPQLADALDRAVEKCAITLGDELAPQLPEIKIVLLSLRRNLHQLLVFHRDFARRNNLRPLALELTFGSFSQPDQGIPIAPGLPAYPVKADHQTIKIRGKIDRVDADRQGRAIVIDYKLSEKRFDASDLQIGLNLQLMTYLLALAGQKILGEIISFHPIGGFYQVLSPPIKVNKPRSFKMRGLFDNQNYATIDPTDPGPASLFVAIKRTKNGFYQFGFGHDGIDHPQFHAVLNFTQNKLAKLSELALSGNIAPDPYRKKSQTPCIHCDYKSACPFDRLRGRYRKFTGNNKTALANITGREGDS